mmetsp:Transcript_13499/g.45049  ORF Transcript_13499/g.45049 Transcript_13499/m.45049 type:complete len:610 (+) Transcript_13499:784-2613(+)
MLHEVAKRLAGAPVRACLVVENVHHSMPRVPPLARVAAGLSVKDVLEALDCVVVRVLKRLASLELDHTAILLLDPHDDPAAVMVVGLTPQRVPWPLALAGRIDHCQLVAGDADMLPNVAFGEQVPCLHHLAFDAFDPFAHATPHLALVAFEARQHAERRVLRLARDKVHSVNVLGELARLRRREREQLISQPHAAVHKVHVPRQHALLDLLQLLVRIVKVRIVHVPDRRLLEYACRVQLRCKERLRLVDLRRRQLSAQVEALRVEKRVEQLERAPKGVLNRGLRAGHQFDLQERLPLERTHADDLDRRERWEGDLPLFRILGDELEVRAAAMQPHADLEQHAVLRARVFGPPSIRRSDLEAHGGRERRHLHAADATEFVLHHHGVGQAEAPEATVDLACMRQLAQLHEPRRKQMQAGGVQVEPSPERLLEGSGALGRAAKFAQLSERRGGDRSAHVPQHAVVLHEHRAGVQAAHDDLFARHCVASHRREGVVLAPDHLVEVRQRLWLAPCPQLAAVRLQNFDVPERPAAIGWIIRRHNEAPLDARSAVTEVREELPVRVDGPRVLRFHRREHVVVHTPDELLQRRRVAMQAGEHEFGRGRCAVDDHRLG